MAARFLLCAVITAPVFAWTSPAIVSNTGYNYGLMPRIAPGFGGKLYLSWHQQGWPVYFRERSAGGTWSSITTLRDNANWAADTTITEDGQYRPHVAYTEQDGAGTRYLVHHYRNSQGTWVRTVLSYGNEESCPVMDADSTGKVHLVYAKGSNNQHYLYHRIWTNGVWGADIAVGSGAIESGRVGYDRPDLQASGAVLHMAWIQPGGDRYVVRYRRYEGTAWGTGKTIGQSVSQSWMTNCRLAVADANTIVAAWVRGTKAFSVVSTDGGETWSAEQQITSVDMSPANMFGRGGRAYLVSSAAPSPPNMLLYTWANGAWNAGEVVNTGEANFNGWGDVTQTVDDAIHVVYYHAINSGNTAGGVDYVMQPSTLATGTVTGRVMDAVGPVPYATITSSLGGQATSNSNGNFSLACPAGTVTVRVTMLGYNTTDLPNVVVNVGQTTAIGDVLLTGLAPMLPNSSVTSTPLNSKVYLAWQNSSSVNFSGTLIIYRTDRYPTSPTDGTVALDKDGAAGAADNYMHTGVTNGTQLYYALFAHDNHPIRTYTSAITTTTIPHMQVDRDTDGDVDASDFGWFQACLTGEYEPQYETACGDALLDNDNDVDAADMSIFQDCFRGSGVLANASCLP